jgi:hypothetical protein
VRRAPGAGADIEQSTVRSELTRILLVVLGQSPSGVPVTFTYAGAAEAPDGNAEALDVKGNNIDARLYVDSKTYLPVMLAYKGVEPRIRTASVPRAQAERRDAADLERRMRDAQLNEPPPPMVDMQLFVGEHKNVDGLVLPHRLTVSIGERTSEEWEITSYKTNAALDPAIFVKPPKAS